jgi:hypothetical protein
MNTPEYIADDVRFANAVVIAITADQALPLLKEVRRCLLRRNRQSGGLTKGARP